MTKNSRLIARLSLMPIRGSASAGLIAATLLLDCSTTTVTPPQPTVKIPPVELPEYAKRGKRLPAHGAAPGRAVITYCHTFEIDKDAASYFNALTRIRRLPTTKEVAHIAVRFVARCIPDSPHCARRCR